jgi:hypothetical protein
MSFFIILFSFNSQFIRSNSFPNPMAKLIEDIYAVTSPPFLAPLHGCGIKESRFIPGAFALEDHHAARP